MYRLHPIHFTFAHLNLGCNLVSKWPTPHKSTLNSKCWSAVAKISHTKKEVFYNRQNQEAHTSVNWLTFSNNFLGREVQQKRPSYTLFITNWNISKIESVLKYVIHNSSLWFNIRRFISFLNICERKHWILWSSPWHGLLARQDEVHLLVAHDVVQVREPIFLERVLQYILNFLHHVLLKSVGF